ncbi:oxidoreductase [Nocardioides yefusunii]|uniref:Oxidoreductase n=1 Tax=Nocardioides yefusunii TaxID=2500546 RepID=A0ABW1QZU4_9ACTN|nr:oxidoreductase [Nocardioides yefusunii]
MTTDPLAWLMALEGVPSAFASTRDGIDALLRDRGLRKTHPEDTGQALVMGAHASAVLEGSTSTIDDVLAGRTDATAQDALRLSAQVLSLVPQMRTAPLQAIARLHAIAGATSLGQEDLGRPRNAEVASRLQTVAKMLTSDTTAPALVVAAMVHADIATAKPFASHNGIVARAAERLVMVSRGVDATSVLVPEAGHLALREQYESNLRAYASGTERGVHAWALYAAEAYAKGAELTPLKPVKKRRRDAEPVDLSQLEG